LGIGGNIGNKQSNFENVLKITETELGRIIKKSSVYETPPWGFDSGENFWNQVILIETKLSPFELLEAIHKIEQHFGRKREGTGYNSREMDIDILYYDDIFMDHKNLVIPHPKMQLRKFVLVPLNEIAPDLKHPLFRFTSFQLLENCRDNSVIFKLENPAR
jgi:2-amino-4-hydroxy-6-hydroxymethyldihydropteridine diphosphokinase